MAALAAERDIRQKLRSASRIEPDRLPRLRAIGTEWAETLGRTLADRYGATIAVGFLGTALLESGERERAAPAILAFAPSPGWSDPALLLMDDSFADVVIDGLCGGDGRRSGTVARAMTTLDRRFVKLALDAALAVGDEVLKPLMTSRMAVERMVSVKPAEALDAVLDEDARTYVEFRFRLELGRTTSLFSVALPETALAPHRRKLTQLPEQAPVAADADWARDIQEGLQHADMHLRAFLDEKKTTLGEIAGFRVGQTIVLDARVDSLLTIECEEQRLFRGRMGRDRDGYVVRIEEAVDATQEFIDDILSD